MKLPGVDLYQLLEKYHSNTASAEERQVLEQWYEQLDIPAGRALQSAEHELSIKHEIYAGIATKISLANVAAPEQTVPVKKNAPVIPWRRMSQAAAVLLLVAGVAWMAQAVWRKKLVVTQLNPAKRNEGTVFPDAGKLIPAKELVVHSGSTGSRKIVLPDGSTAWLNARSVLKYPDHFTGNNRPVRVVQGEVFFTVVRDTVHPFTVYTGSVATTVLGTSFLVKQSFEKNTVEISVKTGKVKVEKFAVNGAHAMVARYLLPSDQLSFDTAANTYQLKQVSLKGIAAFIEGKLSYDDATLEEIVYDIGHKYNINISFGNDRLRQCHYRISFDDIALNDCLQVLSALTNTRIEKQDNRHYIIKGESCN